MSELVGSAEIAQLLGISRQRVNQLAAQPTFPTPLADLASGRIWDGAQVRAWAEERGREVLPAR